MDTTTSSFSESHQVNFHYQQSQLLTITSTVNNTCVQFNQFNETSFRQQELSFGQESQISSPTVSNLISEQDQVQIDR